MSFLSHPKDIQSLLYSDTPHFTLLLNFIKSIYRLSKYFSSQFDIFCLTLF